MNDFNNGFGQFRNPDYIQVTEGYIKNYNNNPKRVKKPFIILAIIGLILVLGLIILAGSKFVKQTKTELPKTRIIVDGVSAWRILDNGEVYVSGIDKYGYFGFGNEPVEINIPTRVEALKELDIVDVVTDGYCAYYLTKEGEVYVSGNNVSGQLGIGNNNNIGVITKVSDLDRIKIEKIYTNYDSVYCLSENGEVYVSGNNASGQLGLGHTNNVNKITKIPQLEKVKEVVIQEKSMSGYSSQRDSQQIAIFITENGEVYVTGSNDYGQLGLGHKNNVSTPTKVEALSGKKIKEAQIDRLDNNIYYLTEKGEVYGSGKEIKEQLRINGVDEEKNIVKLKSADNKKVVDITYAPEYCITEDNRVVYLHLEGVNNGSFDATKTYFDNKKVEKIKKGDWAEFYYITKDGKVYPSGHNQYGELGLGHKNSVHIIDKVGIIPALSKEKIVDVIFDTTYSESVYYLTEKGEVYVSGENVYGQLGLGNTNEVMTATKIPNLTNIKEVVVEGKNVFFINADGEVYVCGENACGVLGLGHSNNVTVPTLSSIKL